MPIWKHASVKSPDGGLTGEEIAELEGVSRTTIKQDWKLARVWLHRKIARTA